MIYDMICDIIEKLPRELSWYRQAQVDLQQGCAETALNGPPWPRPPPPQSQISSYQSHRWLPRPFLSHDELSSGFPYFVRLASFSLPQLCSYLQIDNWLSKRSERRLRLDEIGNLFFRWMSSVSFGLEATVFKRFWWNVAQEFLDFQLRFCRYLE